MDSIFFHIDVNSAFLSWTAISLLETGKNLDLRTVPSIIGGNEKSRHGIILAASIPAKKLGIKTGEPLAIALKKCPTLEMASPDYNLYENFSHQFITYLQNFTSDIEQLSIDECFLDFTPIANFYPTAIDAAHIIKDAIYNDLGFTVNIGISNRKVLAKMASDFKKPNLVHTLFDTEIAAKMWPLPISDLYMCGKSSQHTLHNLGVVTIGDLAKLDISILEAHLKSHGRLLWDYANGIDNSSVISTPIKRKGVGNSITLSKDLCTKEEAYNTLLALSESVATRLRFEHDVTTLIAVEIKYNTFETVSRQTTLTTPTNSTQSIYQTACNLFQNLWNGNPVRLLGIRTSKLASDTQPMQLDLFSFHASDTTKKQKKIDATLDSIREKYGPNSIVRGSVLNSPHKHFKKE